MRVVVPVLEDNGLESKLSGHFGRAPFFAVVDIQNDGSYEIKIQPNQSEHFGGRGFASENIARFSPDAVITFGMGPRAIEILNQQNIKVLKAVSPKLKDNVEYYIKDRLSELEESCHESRR